MVQAQLLFHIREAPCIFTVSILHFAGISFIPISHSSSCPPWQHCQALGPDIWILPSCSQHLDLSLSKETGFCVPWSQQVCSGHRRVGFGSCGCREVATCWYQPCSQPSCPEPCIVKERDRRYKKRHRDIM